MLVWLPHIFVFALANTTKFEMVAMILSVVSKIVDFSPAVMRMRYGVQLHCRRLDGRTTNASATVYNPFHYYRNNFGCVLCCVLFCMFVPGVRFCGGIGARNDNSLSTAATRILFFPFCSYRVCMCSRKGCILSSSPGPDFARIALSFTI